MVPSDSFATIVKSRPAALGGKVNSATNLPPSSAVAVAISFPSTSSDSTAPGSACPAIRVEPSVSTRTTSKVGATGAGAGVATTEAVAATSAGAGATAAVALAVASGAKAGVAAVVVASGAGTGVAGAAVVGAAVSAAFVADVVATASVLATSPVTGACGTLLFHSSYPPPNSSRTAAIADARAPAFISDQPAICHPPESGACFRPLLSIGPKPSYHRQSNRFSAISPG